MLDHDLREDLADGGVLCDRNPAEFVEDHQIEEDLDPSREPRQGAFSILRHVALLLRGVPQTPTRCSEARAIAMSDSERTPNPIVGNASTSNSASAQPDQVSFSGVEGDVRNIA